MIRIIRHFLNLGAFINKVCQQILSVVNQHSNIISDISSKIKVMNMNINTITNTNSTNSTNTATIATMLQNIINQTNMFPSNTDMYTYSSNGKSSLDVDSFYKSDKFKKIKLEYDTAITTHIRGCANSGNTDDLTLLQCNMDACTAIFNINVITEINKQSHNH
jgi:hypothetical protein